ADPGQDPVTEARAVIDQLLARVTREDREHLITLPSAATQQLARLTGRGFDGVPTGFPDLDRRVGGMPRGELTILASRPGMGKSALAHQVAARLGRRGLRVLLATPEMSAGQVAARVLAWSSDVALARLRFNTLHAAERDRLQAAAADLPTVVWLYDAGAQTTADIHAVARRTRAALGGLDLVIVDHLQYLADPTARNESRAIAVGRMTRSLKQLARASEAAVLVLSQLNRECESRDDKKPRLSDLKESGDIEQDADCVWLLFRPHYYDDGADPHAAELLVAKARNGQTGTVALRWWGET